VVGRSRGGPSTKIHAIVEARGLPVEVLISKRQRIPAGCGWWVRRRRLMRCFW
jgi:hypothetical protein